MDGSVFVHHFARFEPGLFLFRSGGGGDHRAGLVGVFSQKKKGGERAGMGSEEERQERRRAQLNYGASSLSFFLEPNLTTRVEILGRILQ